MSRKKTQFMILIQRAKVRQDRIISSNSLYHRTLHLRFLFGNRHLAQKKFCEASHFLVCGGHNCSVVASVSPVMRTETKSHGTSSHIQITKTLVCICCYSIIPGVLIKIIVYKFPQLSQLQTALYTYLSCALSL